MTMEKGKRMSIRAKLGIFIVVLLVLDQAVKIWIKTHMMIGDEFNVIGDWFKIHFIENNGMAFGMELGGEWGKMMLSLFRIMAVTLIGWYIFHLLKQKAPKGVIFSCGRRRRAGCSWPAIRRRLRRCRTIRW